MPPPLVPVRRPPLPVPPPPARALHERCGLPVGTAPAAPAFDAVNSACCHGRPDPAAEPGRWLSFACRSAGLSSPDLSSADAVGRVRRSDTRVCVTPPVEAGRAAGADAAAATASPESAGCGPAEGSPAGFHSRAVCSSVAASLAPPNQ
eukprot:364918-Chlamydomonas_euryale.AAC.3